MSSLNKPSRACILVKQHLCVVVVVVVVVVIIIIIITIIIIIINLVNSKYSKRYELK